MSSKRMELAAQRRAARQRFMQSRVAEREFAASLAAAGRQIGRLVDDMTNRGKVINVKGLERSLKAYSETLEPWARAVTEKMQAQVNRRDLTAWKQLTQSMGSSLHREVAQTPVGLYLRDLLEEQVGLITSLPLDAAQRVHELTTINIYTGSRASNVEAEIMKTGQVSQARARLIARTETSRTATTLTMARATHIGSEGYLWRGILDEAERKEHVKLEGNFFRWDNPPIAGKGKGGVPMRYHPGCGPNCRCFPEPVIPEL